MTELDNPAELRALERRTLAMELRFSYRCDNVTYIGSGRLRNLSATAVCFEVDQDLRGRSDLELRIPWPSRLQSICPLELVVRGPLVRKHKSLAVIRMDSYEFQTRGERSFNTLSDCGGICDIAA
jgi:hypothetical protein